jgi:hypothetical protein
MKNLWFQFFKKNENKNATLRNCSFNSWFQTYFVKKKTISKIPVPVPKLSLGLALVPEPDLI